MGLKAHRTDTLVWFARFDVGEFQDLLQLLLLPNHSVSLLVSSQTTLIPMNLQELGQFGNTPGWSILFPQNDMLNKYRDSLHNIDAMDNVHHMMLFLLSAARSPSKLTIHNWVGAWAIDRNNPGDRNIGYLGVKYGQMIPRDRRTLMSDWDYESWVKGICDELLPGGFTPPPNPNKTGR